MNGFGYGDRPGNTPELLLRASECCLRNRNFDGCRKYALQAQEANAGGNAAAAAAQILAIVDVLSASSKSRFNGNQPEWYAILGVNRYSEDSHLIRNRFMNFVKALNPTKNKFPFADEAFGLVRDAWKVLSIPSEKARFDNELRIVESESETEKQRDGGGGERTAEEGQCAAAASGGVDETFWSACPYCYYVYEYYRVVEDCSVRCWNQNCRRAFQAVAVLSPPPAAVVSSGRYWCLGFSPVGFGGEEGKGFSSWTPFAPLFMETHQKEEVEKESARRRRNGSNGDNLIEISDDSDDEAVGTEEAKQKKKRKGVGEEEDVVGTSSATKPVVKRRKKSVARNSKKILGKGIRVNKDNTTGNTGAC